MASPSADVATKVSTEAAERFTESYYPALKSNRETLSSYYIPPSAMPDGKPLPAIVFNGNVIPDPATFQNMFVKEMPPTHYEVQSFDCQVLNPNLLAGGPDANTGGSGKNMTILLVVSGYVRIGEPREGPMRGFSDSIVLVPNPDKTAEKGRAPRSKWLIQSQTSRFVV
ncbi:MAG: hypothetical protein M1819_002732 [Sarea resinae]|nr:MAG: hypothetical protein M1819_002732 [Sarea resinae]